MDVSVTDLNALDQVSIHTQNSEYQFQLIDPAQCRGLLSGGVFGNKQYEAVLTASINALQRTGQFSTKLETGTCARFYILIRQTLRTLTTSVITNLTVGH